MGTSKDVFEWESYEWERKFKELAKLKKTKKKTKRRKNKRFCF